MGGGREKMDICGGRPTGKVSVVYFSEGGGREVLTNGPAASPWGKALLRREGCVSVENRNVAGGTAYNGDGV